MLLSDFLFLLCRRCCRAPRQRCLHPPIPPRASWCPRPRCPRQTWPWARAAAHLPCQVGTGEGLQGSWDSGGVATPTCALFCTGGALYQPVTMVTSQGQVLAQAITPGALQIPNAQVSLASFSFSKALLCSRLNPPISPEIQSWECLKFLISKKR